MTEDFRQPLIGFISGELLMRDLGSPVTEDEELLFSGLLDSIAVMRLVGFIESDLAVPVPPEDVTLDNFTTVDAISQYLTTRAGCAD